MARRSARQCRALHGSGLRCGWQIERERRILAGTGAVRAEHTTERKDTRQVFRLNADAGISHLEPHEAFPVFSQADVQPQPRRSCRRAQRVPGITDQINQNL